MVFGLVAILILVVAGVAAKPAYRKFKQWRATRLAETAERLLEEKRPADARQKAHAALLLAPRQPAALRVMARALSQETNLAALQFWGQLIQTGQATVADRRMFIEQALQAGAAEVAGREVQRLLREAPEDAAHLWLAAQWFALVQLRAQALEYAAKAALREPTNRQYKLFVSRLQFDAAEETQRLTARSNVWNRAREADALGLEALEFLARRRDLKSAEQQELVSLLERHPGHSVAHDLLALSLRVQSEPARRNAILTEALERFRAGEPERRLAFAVWLNQNGENERVLQALPLEEAIKRRDYLLAHLDALAALARWSELRTLLETRQTPLEAAYVNAFRARCDTELKQPELATLHWRSALQAAERNPEQLLWLARYAEKCRETELALKSLRALIVCVGNPLPAFRELEGLVERTGSTAELRDLLDEMARRWPNDPVILNRLAYLNLLLGRELAEAHRVAARLVAAAPENTVFRTTLALALLQQRDFPAALKSYEGLDHPWTQAPPNQRVVLAAVLAANGRTKEAEAVIAGLTIPALRPEERKLIEPLLR